MTISGTRLGRLIFCSYQILSSSSRKFSLRSATQSHFLGNSDGVSLKTCKLFQILTAPKTSQYPHLLGIRHQSSSSKDSSEEKIPIEVLEDDIISEELMKPQRVFVDMKIEDFEDLYKDDETENIKSRIEQFLNEYEFLKYNSAGRVPSRLYIQDVLRLLKERDSPAAREKVFNYLFKREMAKLNYKIKKDIFKRLTTTRNRQKREERLSQHGEHGRTGLICDKGKLIYGLWHNSLFPRITDRKFSVNTSLNNLIRAAIAGRTLIFDFDYEDYMSITSCSSLAEQIVLSYSVNRFQYEDCYDLWFCNYKWNSNTAKTLQAGGLANLAKENLGITVKEDCFLNHFDKSRLVYLSPNARTRLRETNDNDIYIIGAFNDKGNTRPLSYRKALDLGIRCMSLPIDDFLSWQGPSKSLCLNHVVGILLEYQHNGRDWKEALLKHTPSRKIKPLEVVMEEEERRRLRYKNKLFNKEFTLRY